VQQAKPPYFSRFLPLCKVHRGKQNAPLPAISLYLRLSGFYLCYFASLGVLLPYWSLYLQSLGLVPARIGELTAILSATKVVAPNVWGWLADRSGRRMVSVRLACLAALLSFAGVYRAGDVFLDLGLVIFLFSFFWNAALPQFESITLNHLGAHVHLYSRIRLWGSVGFIVTALVAGILVQRVGTHIVPTVLLLLLAALWLNSLLVPADQHHPEQLEQPPISGVLRHPPVVALLLVSFLNQFSHGPYYTFFSIYLEGLGYSRTLIGGLWDLGVVAEIGMFLLVPWLLPRLGARRLMLAAMALTSLRWLLIGRFADRLPLLLFAQTLHAFSFGLSHAVAIYLIHQFFTGCHQGRGQALYSSSSFGAGGALGSLAAGYLWSSGGAEATFVLAAGVSTVGFLVAWRGLRL
jgi:PPP family 3-phenylpropionic acid transporter